MYRGATAEFGNFLVKAALATIHRQFLPVQCGKTVAEHSEIYNLRRQPFLEG
ncbi:hypothetical protein Pan258_04940 [Symmachiella dynata]|nr:hypothetical protein Pan258_04940 [Symmachiella dynata]